MRQTLRLEHVKKYYGNHGNITKAVDGISLHVDQGEFVAVMGASGSGKSTLLNCIAAIDSVTSGHIFVSGQDITAIRERDLADFRRENLGFIFQDFNLLDTLTIGENISMAQIISGASPKMIDRRVADIAGKLGISGILGKLPYAGCHHPHGHPRPVLRFLLRAHPCPEGREDLHRDTQRREYEKRIFH